MAEFSDLQLNKNKTMHYKILDYKASPGCPKAMIWMIDVKVEITEYIFWIFPWRRRKWISAGQDGQPRFFEKKFHKYHSENRLFVCKSKYTALKRIEELKQVPAWNQIKVL